MADNVIMGPLKLEILTFPDWNGEDEGAFFKVVQEGDELEGFWGTFWPGMPTDEELKKAIVDKKKRAKRKRLNVLKDHVKEAKRFNQKVEVNRAKLWAAERALREYRADHRFDFFHKKMLRKKRPAPTSKIFPTIPTTEELNAGTK